MLEEQLLQLKSGHLRDKSQASGASEVARTMQVCLDVLCAVYESWCTATVYWYG